MLVFAQQVAYAEIRHGAAWWVDSSLSAVESFPSWTATVPGKGSPEPCPEPQIMTQPLLLWGVGGGKEIKQVSVRQRKVMLSADWL